MPVIIGEQTIVGDKVQDVPYYKRKIRCPGHFLIPPKVDIYLYEPVPWMSALSGRKFIEVLGKKLNIRRKRIKKDAFGRKMVDWKKLHKLRDAGIVMQPWVSSSWVIENIYDPYSWLCLNCDKRCLEGKGNILTKTIRRLSGG